MALFQFGNLTGNASPAGLQPLPEFHFEDNRWRARISLPGRHRMLVPSLSCHTRNISFQFHINAAGADHALTPVAFGDVTPEPEQPVHHELDLLTLQEPVDGVTVTVELRGISQHPAQLPLLISISSREQQPDLLLPDTRHTAPRTVPRISQMALDHPQRKAVCSPVSLAMVLQYWRCHAPVQEVVQCCASERHKLYGLWPRAIQTAARYSCHGWTQVFENANELAAMLRRGPIVISIAFEKGTLAQAPLASTAGHLLVLTSLADGIAHVNDPAAADDSEVSRRYCADELLAAWWRHRGIGYVILPPDRSAP